MRHHRRKADFLARLFRPWRDFLYNFVFHVFFGDGGGFIGWADSPFQFEVGMASLGFSAMAFTAAFRKLRPAAGGDLGSSFVLLGAAAGHVYQMVTERNFSPGNAGIIFYMDIIVPLVGSYCSGCSVVTPSAARLIWPGRVTTGMQPTVCPGC